MKFNDLAVGQHFRFVADEDYPGEWVKVGRVTFRRPTTPTQRWSQTNVTGINTTVAPLAQENAA